MYHRCMKPTSLKRVREKVQTKDFRKSGDLKAKELYIGTRIVLDKVVPDEGTN